MNREPRALSLTEVLVVIAIIGLLAALILPVFVHARDYSKIAPCTANLKQYGAALAMYEAGNDETLPPRIGNLLLADPAISPILQCPSDPTSGASRQDSELTHRKISYFLVSFRPGLRAALRAADPNFGTMYCVCHGERSPDPFPEFIPARDTTGLVLRLRHDGSVQHAQVPRWCGPNIGGSMFVERLEWTLLSDTHCVGEYCDGLIGPCK